MSLQKKRKWSDAMSRTMCMTRRSTQLVYYTGNGARDTNVFTLEGFSALIRRLYSKEVEHLDDDCDLVEWAGALWIDSRY